MADGGYWLEVKGICVDGRCAREEEGDVFGVRVCAWAMNVVENV